MGTSENFFQLLTILLYW